MRMSDMIRINGVINCALLQLRKAIIELFSVLFSHIFLILFTVFWFKASDVPCWMFISWINQMLAVLNKSEGKAVHAILQDIAQTYPQVSHTYSQGNRFVNGLKLGATP